MDNLNGRFQTVPEMFDVRTEACFLRAGRKSHGGEDEEPFSRQIDIHILHCVEETLRKGTVLLST